MAKGTLALAFLFFMSMAALSVATVYKVGDDAGWTAVGNIPDYRKWSATKTFKVGDTIVFVYNPQYHNVMQVSHLEWRSCNVTAPRKIYSTGNDSITISNYGHLYFVCGVPGHCQAGQKVDIRIVPSAGNAPAPTPPTPTTPPPSTTTMAPPPPSTNSAASSAVGFLSLVATLVVSSIVAF